MQSADFRLQKKAQVKTRVTERSSDSACLRLSPERNLQTSFIIQPFLWTLQLDGLIGAISTYNVAAPIGLIILGLPTSAILQPPPHQSPVVQSSDRYSRGSFSLLAIDHP